MHSSFRRFGMLTAATVLAAGAAVPLASPASAVPAPTTSRTYFLRDTNADNTYGLYYSESVGGSAVKVFESSSASISWLSSSADGSRIAYEQVTSGPSGDALQVVVRDVSGRLVRVVSDEPLPNGIEPNGVLLSPSGDQVVWQTKNQGTGDVDIETTTVAAGAATTTVASGIGSAESFYGDDLLINTDYHGSYVQMSLAGAITGGFSFLPLTTNSLIGFLHVSPDGSLVTWTELPPPSFDTGDLVLGSFNGTQATALWKLSADSTTQINFGAVWTDSTHVAWVNQDRSSGVTDLQSRVMDNSLPITTFATTENEGWLAQTTLDSTAPGAVTPQPAVLNGTSATVTWSPPADSDLTGVEVTRTSGTATPVTVFVRAPATSWTDTGLTVGTTYQYAFRAVDRSGNASPESTHNLTALAVSPNAADPTSTLTTKAPFPVYFLAKGTVVPSSVSFTVAYRKNNGAPTPWLAGVSATAATFSAAVVGATYAFDVTATDAYGNSTATRTSAKTVVPYDQTKASFSSGVATTASGAWLGSYKSLSAVGSYAKVAVFGNRLQVIGLRCAACGVFDVYDGSTRIGTIDSYASTTKYRQVLFTKTWTANGSHTIVIKARGTSGRPYVRLDGFGIRV